MFIDSSCLNGGGQTKPNSGLSPNELSQLLESKYMENVSSIILERLKKSSKLCLVRKRPKRGFNLGAPMNNCLLAKSMNTLEVSSLLLVGVLLYGTQQSPLRCLSFCDLLKGIGCLLLTKLFFLNKGSLCPLCSNEPESNAHLFFSCRKSPIGTS